MTIESVEASVIGFLSNMPGKKTPEKVREVLRTFLRMRADLDAEVSDETVEICARRIESKLAIDMADAASIQLPFVEWLPSRRATTTDFYYGRYRSFLQNRGFTPAVLGVLDKDTDKITGLFENPLRTGAWTRRGLVVGHVQSGKTANYTGVISKAADYGYRFIVLLTGIQENLRVQTQERIEDGFIGLNSEAKGIDASQARTGVGLLDISRRPMSLTSRSSDFNQNSANLPVALQAAAEPIILVMKKNARLLRNLIDWLRRNSQDQGGRIAGVPMLLIDDEADNASINTSGNPDLPNRINQQLRELLGLFERNVYVGYTATPFANIFIDPDSKDAMEQEDLFPRDFIVSLDAPTNYVGGSRMFLEDGDLRYCLREVSDHHTLLPEKHKITHSPGELPESLREAIRSFVIARAVRICRGHGSAHSSMLVNVSRFNDVQQKVAGLVIDYLGSLREACKGHAALMPYQALAEPHIRDLHRAWGAWLQGHAPEPWESLLPLLPQAIGPVDVRTINSRSADALDYRRYKESGLHVIAVGGLSLSRGFTLEGLTVSYFLRNSVMYDTLLQMGRWFGYRDGYEDICRLYMTGSAIGWYAHVWDAAEELRDEFRRMERAGRAPKDFGLRVRSHPDSLIVTARNKMRTGRKVTHSVALGGRLIETTALRDDAIDRNLESLERVVARLVREYGRPASDGGYLWSQVPAEVVTDFVRGFVNHDDACMKTQAEPVVRYIDSRRDYELGLWDVVMISPQETELASPHTVAGLPVRRQYRRSEYRRNAAGPGYFAVSGSAGRVASRGAEKAGLDAEEMAAARAMFEAETSSAGIKKRSISDKHYRNVRSRPLLMLHVLGLSTKDREVLPSANDPDLTVTAAAAWGISFPRTQGGAAADPIEVEYVVNTQWWRENYGDDMEEYEEEQQAVADVV
ncbi:MAG: Z1 domain-containing protein [Chromatiales bacterium]|nr:Z1 domain-containing protein [Chromatiales bacterium]